jgi:hypothetical protein
VFDQRANEDGALRQWRAQLEAIERILNGPNCNHTLLHTRRLIEQRQHLEVKIAELEGKRARESATPQRNRDQSQGFLESSEGGRDILKDGERCDKIIKQIRKIRNMVRGHGDTMSEVRGKFPGLEVWQVADGLTGEDRDTFNHPNQWGPVVGYAKSLLAKDYGVAKATIGNWVKTYRRGTPSARVRRITSKK